MLTVLESLAVYNCHVVVTSDFNIHVDDTSSASATPLLELFGTLGLSQVVSGPTHRYGHTLDLIFTRSDQLRPEVTIDLPQISDHSVVFFKVLLQPPPVRFIDVSTRAWRGFDSDTFRRDLLESPLCIQDSYARLSTDELQELYDSTLMDLLNRHAPKRKIRCRHQPSSPWFDSECTAAKRRTRAFERRYRRTKSASDRRAWTDQVSQLHKLYTTKQNMFWRINVVESKRNPRKLWKTISSVLCKGKSGDQSGTVGLNAMLSTTTS
jgi:hypothetical protein